MTGHARFTRLAAASIDFDLPPEERTDLAAHLKTCRECRTIAAAYGADAARLRYGAVVHAPERVRAAILGAAARRPPARPMWQLLLAAALALLMLSALVFAAGAVRQLLDGPMGPITWRAVPGDSLPAGSENLVLQRIASGNGRFVALGQANGSPVALVSSDGSTWEIGTGFDGGAVRDISFVVDGPGQGSFVAMGSLGQVPTIWRSSDGAAWTVEGFPDDSGDVLAVASLDATTVVITSVVGQRDPALEPGPDGEEVRVLAVRRSIEPGRWQVASIVGETPSHDSDRVALARTDAGFAALTGSALMVSATGESWIHQSDIGIAGPTGGLAWSAGTYVASGSGRDAALLRVSDDGRTWSDVSLPDAAGAVIADVSAHDGLFLAVGSGRRGVMTWYSEDAVTWQAGDRIPIGGGALMADAAWSGNGVVAIGAVGADAAIWIGEVEDR